MREAFRRFLLRSSYLGLAITVLMMVLWPFVEKIFGRFEPITLLGVAVGILLAFVAYFDELGNRILDANRDLEIEGIGDAFKQILERNKRQFNKIRIYALTTEVILPAFREQNCNIGACVVLLHKFNESGPIVRAKTLNARVSQVRFQWK